MDLRTTIDTELDGKTVLAALRARFSISKRLLKRLKANSLITVNGVFARTNERLRAGDELRVALDALADEAVGRIAPEPMDLDILYEDEFLIALNKPAGVIIHPATKGGGGGTLANGLAHYFAETGVRSKVHPVSRLDRDTTGAILFSKDRYTGRLLGEAMARGQCKKEYLAIARGAPVPACGVINLPLARVPGSIMLRRAQTGGSAAKTYYRTLATANGASLVKLFPATGRTHQIRVHLMSIGCPVLHDSLYTAVLDTGAPPPPLSDAQPRAQRQMLHSLRLTLAHPRTGAPLAITAPPPPDFLTEGRSFLS